MSDEIINQITLAGNAHHVGMIFINIGVVLLIYAFITTFIVPIVISNISSKRFFKRADLIEEIKNDEKMREIYSTELSKEDFEAFEEELTSKKIQADKLRGNTYDSILTNEFIIMLAHILRNNFSFCGCF